MFRVWLCKRSFKFSAVCISFFSRLKFLSNNLRRKQLFWRTTQVKYIAFIILELSVKLFKFFDWFWLLFDINWSLFWVDGEGREGGCVACRVWERRRGEVVFFSRKWVITASEGARFSRQFTHCSSKSQLTQLCVVNCQNSGKPPLITTTITCLSLAGLKSGDNGCKNIISSSNNDFVESVRCKWSDRNAIALNVNSVDRLLFCYNEWLFVWDGAGQCTVIFNPTWKIIVEILQQAGAPSNSYC